MQASARRWSLCLCDSCLPTSLALPYSSTLAPSTNTTHPHTHPHTHTTEHTHTPPLLREIPTRDRYFPFWRLASGVWRLESRASASQRGQVSADKQTGTQRRVNDMIVTSPTLDVSPRVAIKYPGLRIKSPWQTGHPGFEWEISIGRGPDSAHHPDMLDSIRCSG